jgi:hypothetical protein
MFGSTFFAGLPFGGVQGQDAGGGGGGGTGGTIAVIVMDQPNEMNVGNNIGMI